MTRRIEKIEHPNDYTDDKINELIDAINEMRSSEEGCEHSVGLKHGAYKECWKCDKTVHESEIPPRCEKCAGPVECSWCDGTFDEDKQEQKPAKQIAQDQKQKPEEWSGAKDKQEDEEEVYVQVKEKDLETVGHTKMTKRQARELGLI